MEIWKHGDPRADHIKSLAKWPDPMQSDAPQFNSCLELDVIELDERKTFTKEDCQKQFSLDSPTWTPQALINECGWPLVRRNTLIAVRKGNDAFHIIAMFLNKMQSQIFYNLEGARTKTTHNTPECKMLLNSKGWGVTRSCPGERPARAPKVP